MLSSFLQILPANTAKRSSSARHHSRNAKKYEPSFVFQCWTGIEWIFLT